MTRDRFHTEIRSFCSWISFKFLHMKLFTLAYKRWWCFPWMDPGRNEHHFLFYSGTKICCWRKKEFLFFKKKNKPWNWHSFSYIYLTLNKGFVEVERWGSSWVPLFSCLVSCFFQWESWRISKTSATALLRQNLSTKTVFLD